MPKTSNKYKLETEENGQMQIQLPDYNRTYKKSNILISAKYKSTILEEKLWALSLSRLQNQYSNDTEIAKNGEIIVHMRAADIRKLLNIKRGSFYTQLSSAANSMTGKTIGFVDPENERFTYMSVITYAKYENGVFSVAYNSRLKDFILNLRSQYALFSLQVSLKFKNVYGYRLYQILKARCYPHKDEPDRSEYMAYFSLSELKLDLGIVNSELTPVKTILSEKDHPNYDKALAACPESERMFDTWYDLRRYVIDPACEEINQKTEMRVTYSPRKGGRGAKVTGIDFSVGYEGEQETVATPEERNDKGFGVDRSEIIIQIIDLIEEKIKSSDAQAIAEAADYDFSAVEKAYDIAKNTKEVKNLPGFMISALKNKWEEPVGRVKQDKRAKMSNSGNYDTAEIERTLVSNRAG